MDKFNIGDKVNAKDKTYLGKEVGIVVGIDTREDIPEDNFGKYLVKFNSLSMYEGWAYNTFCKNPRYIIEPYEGYAVWLDDLEKAENESEKVCMNEFNIGDKVISKDSYYCSEEVGVVVGIDTKRDTENKEYGVYLVKFDSLDECNGWEYELFSNNPNYIVEPYEGYAMWLDDLEKVEDKCEEECKKDKHEEDIRMEFDIIRKQKKEIVKGMSEKVLQLTSEIKEIENEMEKIIKEWHLD